MIRFGARRSAVTGGPTPMDATRGHANASTCDPSGSPRSHVPRRSRAGVTEGLSRSSTARAHEARATGDRREHGDEAPEATRFRCSRRRKCLARSARSPKRAPRHETESSRDAWGMRRGVHRDDGDTRSLNHQSWVCRHRSRRTGVTAGAAPTWRRELSLRERYAPRSRGEPGDLARRASPGVSPVRACTIRPWRRSIPSRKRAGE